MSTRDSNPDMVTLEDVVREVKISPSTLKRWIDQEKIKGAKRGKPYEIPQGLFDILKQQTEENRGNEDDPFDNLLRYYQATAKLRKIGMSFDEIVKNGIPMDPIELTTDSLLYYDESEGRLRFKDKALFQYEIPAEYSSDGEPFHIGKKYIRKDAVEQLKILREGGKHSPKERKGSPIIFYDINTRVAIYVEETEKSGDFSCEILHKLAFEKLGAQKDIMVACGNCGGTYYKMTFFQVCDEVIFKGSFGAVKTPIVSSYPENDMDLMSRLFAGFNDSTLGVDVQTKPEWFDPVVAIYKKHKESRCRVSR